MSESSEQSSNDDDFRSSLPRSAAISPRRVLSRGGTPNGPIRVPGRRHTIESLPRRRRTIILSPIPPIHLREHRPSLVLASGPTLVVSTVPNPPLLILGGRAILISAPFFLIFGTLWQLTVYYLPDLITTLDVYDDWYNDALGYYVLFSLFQLNYFPWGLGKNRPFKQFIPAALGATRHIISWLCSFILLAIVELMLLAFNVDEINRDGFHFALTVNGIFWSTISHTYFDGWWDSWIKWRPLRLLMWVPPAAVTIYITWYLFPLGFKVHMDNYNEARFVALMALLQWWIVGGLFIGLHLNDLIVDAQQQEVIPASMGRFPIGCLKLGMSVGAGTLLNGVSYLVTRQVYPNSTYVEAWLYSLCIASFFLFPIIQLSVYSNNFASVNSPGFRLTMRGTVVLLIALLYWLYVAALFATGVMNPDKEPIYKRIPATIHLNFVVGIFGVTHEFSGAWGFYYQPSDSEEVNIMPNADQGWDSSPDVISESPLDS
ncbi:hypothetical protein J8273_4377 [Carpediemonas membranifera]|uniref:Uncharacterized protein n=1 Tax=Carpediemonas membranifera TaxID=201153 RepID=A0A8J6AY13_9EUKA|nr:hypothetical protein J8273_4377 [Carpediemonas membranifera]|eukprot:KAG9394275.1 hypothetical protein J8273_4377 [Carpediemonas membranifera]